MTSSAGKYGPLADHLRAQRAAGADQVELRFHSIDALVGGLPPSARTQRTWWANSSHVQALAWRAADYHVDTVDLATQTVTFAPGTVGGTYAARAATQPTDRPTRPSATALRIEQLPELDSLHVAVALRWRDAGHVTLDSAGKLRFPSLPNAPGLYRFTLRADDMTRPRVYIGESSSLRRRAGNYRNPTPRQQTSTRVNELLRDHLAGTGTVHLAVAIEASLDLGEAPGDLDLTRKAGRLLAENAALAVVYAAGEADVENLG